MKTYLEHRDEKSSKFWEITVIDRTATTRWGKIGSDGQSNGKFFASKDEAIADAQKLVIQKMQKGYAPLEDPSPDTKNRSPSAPPLPQETEQKLMNFEVLRDHWLKDSFRSRGKDEFEERFQRLLDDTLMHSPKFSPLTRAEIVKNMLNCHDEYLRLGRNRYFQGDVKKAENQLLGAVTHLLSAGFGGEEVAVDLIGQAPSLEILDAMLEAGINPNSRYQSGVERFCGSNNSAIFDRLVEKGANIELLVDGEIRSNLLNYKYLKKIYEKGSNLNVIDNKGRNPFFYCNYSDDIKKTFNLLKSSGCDINKVDNDGETPLSPELNSSYGIRKVCTNLVAAGASISCPPNPVPLLFRLPEDVESYQINDVLGFIDLLIKKKIDFAELDPNSGITALHYWAGADGKLSRKICEKLLNGGAAVDISNSDGKTPLMYAAQQHAEKSWKLLLSKKANINERSVNGYSVSEWAIARGKEPPQSFLKLLLDSKAPLDGSELGCDLSLLGFLIQNNHYHSALLVIEHGGKITDWVIDTMTKNNPEGEDGALKSITAFIRSIGHRAHEALNTRHQGAIEELLAEVLETSAVDPLESLSPQFWPPIFPERRKIIVSGIDSKELESELAFEVGEIEEYLNVDSGYVNHNVPESAKDEPILARINNPNRGGRIPFDQYSQISDTAMTHSWIEKIASKREILGRGYRWQDDISTDEYKYILARCGVSVVASFLEIAKKKVGIMIRVMQPVADIQWAPTVAAQLYRSPASRAARKWLLRHPQHAIHGLLPLAVGKPGKQREACEAALRYMAYHGLKDEIVEIGETYGSDALESVQEVLSVEHSTDYHLKDSPEIPAPLLEAEIAMPLMKETGVPLSTDNSKALFGMMSLSSFDAVYPPLQNILPLLDRDTLAEFSWNVFQVWNQWNPGWGDKEKKIKKDAEWMYLCIGYMGNDQSIKKLIPLINSWPSSGDMNKAVSGLDILASIGSDFAIRSINRILLKTKYKPLLERAGDIMDRIADVRGLTKAELDDRLVPTFGLDDLKAQTLDFGNQKFTIKINEVLVPTLSDSDNKKVKDLPKPIKADDKAKVKEATEFWRSLKADLKTEASTQLLRFETAMLRGRQWSVADFKSLLVQHPVLCSLVRHLVWGEVKGGTIVHLFRITDGGSCLDVKGLEHTLADDGTVCIPHPLQIKRSVDSWKETMAQNKLKQPFAQITRQTYLKKDDKNNDLFGINGASAPAKAFRGLKAKGWSPAVSDGGAIWSYFKDFSGCTARIGFDGIVTMRDEGLDEDQTLQVSISGKCSDVEYSEVVREIKDILH